VYDLGLKLTRSPAGVADEDPQTVLRARWVTRVLGLHAANSSFDGPLGPGRRRVFAQNSH
jgi:hypothetical protein